MKKIMLLCFLLLCATEQGAAAQSLNDQGVLANDGVFLQRVRQAIINQSINISSDGLSTGVNVKRHTQVQQIMNNPDIFKSLFAAAIATQAAVINPATVTGTVVLTPMGCTAAATAPYPACTGGAVTGNVVTQGALVTDTVINNTVAAVFNTFFGGQ